MPLNTTNETIDKSLELPYQKLIIKVLVYCVIVLAVGAYYVIAMLRDDMKLKDIRIEKLEKEKDECKDKHIEDIKYMTSKVRDLKKLNEDE